MLTCPSRRAADADAASGASVTSPLLPAGPVFSQPGPFLQAPVCSCHLQVTFSRCCLARSHPPSSLGSVCPDWKASCPVPDLAPVPALAEPEGGVTRVCQPSLPRLPEYQVPRARPTPRIRWIRRVLTLLLCLQPAPAGDLGPRAAVAPRGAPSRLLPPHPHAPAGLRGRASPPRRPPRPAHTPRAHLHLGHDVSIQAHPLGRPEDRRAARAFSPGLEAAFPGKRASEWARQATLLPGRSVLGQKFCDVANQAPATRPRS